MSAPPRVHPRNGESVSVIGAGRVGTALAAALAIAGYRIAAVSTVSNRDRVGRLLPDTPVLPPDEATAAAGLSPSEATEAAGLSPSEATEAAGSSPGEPTGGGIVIIAVPDDVLAGLVRGLAAAGAFRPGQFVVHTSGAHGLAPLRPAEEQGALVAAVHPVMTFTGDATSMDEVTFGVTAEEAKARRRAARLVADLGGIPEWIAEPDRTLYHAALAHGANHLVTLVNEARDRLRDAGVRHPERVLRPLLQAALDNSLALGDAALTGPVSRGDAGTVAGHLAALGATAPGSVPPYLALARRTADRAIAAGRLRPVDAAPLLEVLEATKEHV